MIAGAEWPAAGRVAVLLSTYNGERFLAEQLASLQGQTFRGWILYWRDDGSTDATLHMMREFVAGLGPHRSVALPCEGGVGASESFLRLLRAAAADDCDVAAFCDQDDVWLPEKLERGLAALTGVSSEIPALYCARQVLVDAALQRIALSAILHQPPGFPAALTQNIATGCTLMLNRAAARLIAGSRAPAATWHDWWSYLVVSATGGRLLFDATPVVLYRQHPGNVVGAPASLLQRGIAALRRGPAAFMNIFRQNLVALADQPELISVDAREQVVALVRALDGGGPLQRYGALRMRGLTRQTWVETMLFRLWFLLH